MSSAIATGAVFTITMATNQNQESRRKIIDDLKLQQNVDQVPTTIIPSIQPVIIANPREFINVVKYQSNGVGTSTVYTTPTTKDFYLYGFSLSAQDASIADSMNIQAVTESGETVYIAMINTQGGANHLFENSFPSIPIRLKRGSNITVTAGNANNAQAIIYGREVDVM